jgi:hypothetical protein
MGTWEEILSTALVGTGQQDLTISPADDALGGLLHQLDLADRESAVLSAAGVVALWRKAGYQPVTHNQPLSPPCEPDSLPRCRPEAGQSLRLMLLGHYKEVLPEWLAALAQAGRRVSEEDLPGLLDLGLSQPHLRQLISPVLGRRGQWLAAQNPDWVYATDRAEETIWQEGSSAERLFLLQRLRVEKPTQARDLLASTWPQEAAKDRAVYLGTFAAGLSMADEPFLEDLLDDRSKEVRRTAADLLAHLPESRLVQRMLERVKPLLEFKPAKLLRKAQIEVILPETCDEHILRDGIDPKPPRHLEEIGQKAWQLQQLISAVPPHYWSQLWRKTPAEIIAAVPPDWRSTLWPGLATAARRSKDIGWVEALLAVWPKPNAFMEGLLGILTPEQREAYALAALQTESDPLKNETLASTALRHCQHTWSVALTRAVLREVHQHIAGNKSKDWQNYWRLQAGFISFAHHIPPELLAEVSAGWPKQASNWSQWEGTVEEFLSILQFRHDMLQAMR